MNHDKHIDISIGEISEESVLVVEKKRSLLQCAMLKILAEPKLWEMVEKGMNDQWPKLHSNVKMLPKED